ncbi:hypothetical protein GHT06_018603 [Daphnia sinensis]|uniref:Transposable element P transposase-like GTP-binding insertion domain-containing protein n=1 Tax=Daphnia sinensis TaxID=1820382 RepID=A0AAD5PQA9_9CRUS|nr:hypothetical protein GHT06_018603 [Daphnia sinensis]
MERLLERSKKSTYKNHQLKKQLQRKGKLIKELMVIKAILKKAELKNSESMRYDPEFLLECVLLRIKSKSTYDHLRSNHILPLPSPQAIRRLLCCMPCKFGLNSFALSSIKTFLSGKPKNMCYGSLHDVCTEDSSASTTDIPYLADHGLVLIFRPYKASWIQPIAVFASNDLISPHRLVQESLRGSQPNNSTWNIWIGCFFFLRDLRHLFKCSRNHIFNSKDVQAAGKTIQYSNLLKLFQHDEGRGSTGLSVVPKLKPAHLNPKSFQRMSVKLAILSNSVADGLHRYGMSADEKLAGKFNDCKALKAPENSFDVMNARRPADEITETNWNGTGGRHEFWKTKFYCVEIPRTIFIWCMSHVSPILNGLRVTIMSTIDVVEPLLRENYRNVLTGKMKQDCIERFFWIIRMSGRCGDKPTAASFLELFRLLTLYYTTKPELRGVIRDVDDRSIVLTSYSSCIKKRFSNTKKLMKEKRDYFRDILLQGIMREMDLVHSAGNEDLSTKNDDASTTTQKPASSKINVLDCHIATSSIIFVGIWYTHSGRKIGGRTLPFVKVV